MVEHLHCTRRQLGSEDFCTVRPAKEGSRGLYADQPSAAYDQEALKKMKENASMEAIIARWGKMAARSLLHFTQYSRTHTFPCSWGVVIPRFPLLVHTPFLSSAHLHKMTFPFLSDNVSRLA